MEVLKNKIASVWMDFPYRMPYRKEEPTVYVNHYYRKNMDMTDIRDIRHLFRFSGKAENFPQRN